MNGFRETVSLTNERTEKHDSLGLNNSFEGPKVTVRRFCGQSYEKKQYLIWGDNCNEIKFYSVTSSHQGLKGLKLILFDKNVLRF